MNESSFIFLFFGGEFIMKKDKPKYKQIIDAAIIVIAENGYHQSQVSKIAKQAGVADGTIYLYFKNKEEILISVFEEKMEMFADNLKEIINQEISSSDKLYKMIENHFTVLSNDHHLATVTQLELRQANLALRLRINTVLRNYLILLDTILKEGIEQGEFDHKIDIRLARQMVFGTIDETTTTWVMNEHKYNLVDLTGKVHRLLLNGVKA